MRVTSLSPCIGARVDSISITAIDAALAKVLNDIWLEHHVLVVPGGTLREDELIAFARCFGDVEMARKQSKLAGRPEIMVISNIRENGETLGALPDGELSFHFDRIHQKIPNKAGVLHAIELPSIGGDTCFSNMCAAYDALLPSMKARIDGLTALNTYDYGKTTAEAKQLSAGTPSAVHPVVRIIPETGRKALYVCRLMTDCIIGLNAAESRVILDALFDHVEDSQFQYAHHWTVGDTLIWDNRCTIHARTDFPSSERRLMKRVTVGDSVAPYC